MKKTIAIGGKEYQFKTSAAVPRMYRLKFRRDIFVDLDAIDKQIKAQEKLGGEDTGSYLPVDTLTTFENIAYIMHKHGDPSQPDNIDAWIEQFETFDIYQIFPEILSMWVDENKQLSVSKKEAGQ